MTTAEDAKETGRVEAFSDGVFAIAITLLVLELKVPHVGDGGNGRLAAALLAQWPSYLAFVTSFATILIMWVSHHHMFTFVRRADARFLYANGLLLFVVTVVPFPTALVAEYFEKPGSVDGGGGLRRHLRALQHRVQHPLADGHRAAAPSPPGRRVGGKHPGPDATLSLGTSHVRARDRRSVRERRSHLRDLPGSLGFLGRRRSKRVEAGSEAGS